MAEFIGNFPLALMLIPIITGLLLGGYIVSYFFRRRKKSKMKLGYHSSSSMENSDADPAKEPAEETKQEEEISTDILPPPTPSTASPPADTPLTLEDKLDLGILGKSQEPTSAKPSIPEKQEPFSLNTSPAKSTPMVTQNTTTPSEEPEELLRLLRDRQSGQLVVEVAGQRYTKLADVTDKKIGQYILKIAAHLLAFTNGVIVTDAGMKSVYKPKLGQVPKPIGASSVSPPQAATEPPPQPAAPSVPEPDPPAPPQAAPDSSTNSSTSPLNPSGPPPTAQPGGLLNRVTQPPPPPSSLTPLNLAEEIDEIVQARLRYSPLAANTFIKITSDLSGGIRINVNGTHYSNPAEVPDQQAKELIQASIKEWEHS